MRSGLGLSGWKRLGKEAPCSLRSVFSLSGRTRLEWGSVTSLRLGLLKAVLPSVPWSQLVWAGLWARRRELYLLQGPHGSLHLD